MQVPVRFDGGEGGVVVVVGRIGGAEFGGRDGVAQEEGEDAVLRGVGVVFIEGEEDEGFLGEGGVGEEGG